MSEDAVKAAPHVYTSLLENDKVRVLDVKMKAGDKTTMHGHPPVVAYAVTAGKYKFLAPGGGDPMEIEMKAGDTVYMDAVEHATECVTEGHVVLIELKS